MGLFSDITDALGITNEGAVQAGKDASRLAREYSKDAHDILGRGRDRYMQRYRDERKRVLGEVDVNRDIIQRLNEVGFGALGDMQAGAGVGGYLDNIAALSADPRLRSVLDRENALRQRNATSALAAGGLTRSGAAAHAAAEATMTPEQLAMQMEPQLYGRSSALAGLIQSEPVTNMMVPDTSFYDGNMANSILQGGQAILQGNLLRDQGRSDSLAGWGDFFTGGGMGNLITGGQALASGVNPLSVLAGFLSDERLKTNIVELATIKGLPLCSWDWKPEFEGMAGAEMRVGFIAQDLLKVYPECVHDADGVLILDYGHLQELMEAA